MEKTYCTVASVYANEMKLKSINYETNETSEPDVAVVHCMFAV
jgi:hypothetical protein